MELKAFKAAFNELKDLDKTDPKKGKRRFGGHRLKQKEGTEEWED